VSDSIGASPQCGKCVGLHQYCARAKHEGPCVVPRDLPDDGSVFVQETGRGNQVFGVDADLRGMQEASDAALERDVRAVLSRRIYDAGLSRSEARQIANAILADPRISVTLTGWQAMTGGAR
jgi:hypothetical protein